MKVSISQLLVIVVLVILVGVGAFYGAKQIKGGGDRQALFLTNGQVYFGHLSNTGGRYVTLKDIYYLQVQQPIQPAKDNTQPQVSLVKLGSELHGPKDEMFINRDQILFWEDMKNNSKVNDAIAQFIKNGPAPAASSSPAP